MTEPTTDEFLGNVIARLLAVKAELGTIEKDRVDQGGGGTFMAFAVDRVYGHLGPLFNKHGIVVVPYFVSADYEDTHSQSGKKGKWATVVVDYVFHGIDGSTVTMRFGAEGIDYQDKATNKAVQQAFKYGLVQMFQLSTGDVDPDAADLPEQASESAEKPAEVEKPPSLADKRMKKVKDAAWIHTTGADPARIVETKQIVAQVIAKFGGEPKNQTEVEAILAAIKEMFTEDEQP